jgi:hypothetical protein
MAIEMVSLFFLALVIALFGLLGGAELHESIKLKTTKKLQKKGFNSFSKEVKLKFKP